MTRIQEIVQDPEWQELRRSLLGRWIPDQGGCLRRLRAYLGEISDPDHPRFIRVYNYMTGSGFRSGKIRGPEVRRFQEELRAIKRGKR